MVGGHLREPFRHLPVDRDLLVVRVGVQHVLELRARVDAAVDRVHRFNVGAHAPPDVVVGGLLVRVPLNLVPMNR